MTISNRNKGGVNGAYLVFCVSLMMWQFFEIFFFLTNNAFLARLAVDFKIPFVAICVGSMLPYTMKFYGKTARLTHGIMVLIFFIPAVTSLISFTSPMHTLLRKELVVTIGQDLNTMVNVRGPWFWVHTAYCYALIFITEIYMLIQLLTAKKQKKFASYFLFAGVTVTFVINIFTVFSGVSSPLDPTLIGMCVTVILLFVGNVTNDNTGILSIARNEIFNYLKECVFVAGLDGTIVDKNTAAADWISSMGFASTGKFADILKRLDSMGATIKPAIEGENGLDIYLQSDKQLTVYNFTENVICGTAGEQAGSYCILANVTKNRLLINQLSETAGVDPLTGLENRFGFELAKSAFDVDKNLPLTVIFGDLNGLKDINDSLGHKVGDEMLKTTAQLLTSNCPERGSVFRIGGDEYVLLIPNCSAEQAAMLSDDLSRTFRSFDAYPFPLSIALGFAVKEDVSQNLNLLIDEADISMYSQKRASKNENT